MVRAVNLAAANIIARRGAHRAAARRGTLVAIPTDDARQKAIHLRQLKKTGHQICAPRRHDTPFLRHKRCLGRQQRSIRSETGSRQTNSAPRRAWSCSAMILQFRDDVILLLLVSAHHCPKSSRNIRNFYNFTIS